MTIIAAHSQRAPKDVESAGMKRVTQAELAARLPEILEEVNKESETYEVTLPGGEHLILMSTEEYESGEALIELLQNRVGSDGSSESEPGQQSQSETFSLDEVREKLREFHQKRVSSEIK